MGGEKIHTTAKEWPQIGSPPRGRGKVEDWVDILETLGITPAWAGKSCQLAAESAPGWDHPRVGGEKILVRFEQKQG